MSQRTRDMVVNAIIGMLATLFVLFGTGAWSSRESRTDHDRDLSILRAAIADQSNTLQRILDAVCRGPAASERACTAPQSKAPSP